LQPKEFAIFSIKGLLGASPETAAAMWLVCYNTIKETPLSAKRAIPARAIDRLAWP